MRKLLIILFLFNTLASYSMIIESKLTSNILKLVQITQTENDSIDEKALICDAVEQYYIKGRPDIIVLNHNKKIVIVIETGSQMQSAIYKEP